MTNEFIKYRFVSTNEYGRSISRTYIELFAMELHHTLDKRINVPLLEERLNKIIPLNKNCTCDELYKSFTGIIIRNYKKNNRGKTDKVLNKKIRDFMKYEIYGSLVLLEKCKTLYGTNII